MAGITTWYRRNKAIDFKVYLEQHIRVSVALGGYMYCVLSIINLICVKLMVYTYRIV